MLLNGQSTVLESEAEATPLRMRFVIKLLELVSVWTAEDMHHSLMMRMLGIKAMCTATLVWTNRQHTYQLQINGTN
jgi:hypothetical protein